MTEKRPSYESSPVDQEADSEPVGEPSTASAARNVVVFSLLACGLAWIVCLPLWLDGGLANPLFKVIGAAVMATPTLAALVMIFVFRSPAPVSTPSVSSDRPGFLGLKISRPLKRTLLFLGIAAVTPALFVAVLLALASALGGMHLDLAHASALRDLLNTQLTQSGTDPSVIADIPTWTLILGIGFNAGVGVIPTCVATLGEEIGWRGWLLPTLHQQWGMWRALVLSGAIWGLWHAPIILLGYNFGRTDLLGVVLMIIACTVLGVLMGWLRLRSGSIWAGVLAHAGLNQWASFGLMLGAVGAPINLVVVGPLGILSWCLMGMMIAAIAVFGGFRLREG